MTFYEMIAEYTEETVELDEKKLEAKELDEQKLAGKALVEKEMVDEYEKKLAIKWNKLLHASTIQKDSFSAYVYEIMEGKVSIAVAGKSEENPKEIGRRISQILENDRILCRDIQIKEILSEDFRNDISQAENNGIIRNDRRVFRDLQIDYELNRAFSVKEKLCQRSNQNVEEAKRSAQDSLFGSDYLEELERIYSEGNVKSFFEHPVHYHILADSKESAERMTDLLLSSLLENGRLLSGRMNQVFRIDSGCYDEPDFEHMVQNSFGASVMIPLDFCLDEENEYANTFEEAMRYIKKIIQKYQKKVLFLFLEVCSEKKGQKVFLEEIKECMQIMTISEGNGDRHRAEKIIERMIRESEYGFLLEKSNTNISKQQFMHEEIEKLFQDHRTYSLSDIYSLFEEWKRKVLYQNIYQSYGIKEEVVLEKEEEKGIAYRKLEEMIGLSDIKKVTKQIISMYQVQKKRKELGLSDLRSSMHMLFTGNPGSAKTTVARLIAEILYEEGVIQNRHVVECGRAELIGKYVGWTAKIVKNKFREADGGILFIDEAYALVDERGGGFGDEAIHTIVQEMENRRSHVIVIFAGYPDKMEGFLDKNEGLRSRIGFHLNFPDYNGAELLEILKLMVKEKGYVCPDGTLAKCEKILHAASSQKDFGNGRYVRNLLEQAILKQSSRLMLGAGIEKLDKSRMQELIPEDFDVNITDSRKQKVAFGFAS